MSTIAMVYIPCPSQEEASRLARHLLAKKLIVCANIFPITSIYNWEDKAVEETEVVLITKTTTEHFHTVQAEVEKEHPYDTPCILRLSGEANEAYFQWLCGEVS